MRAVLRILILGNLAICCVIAAFSEAESTKIGTIGAAIADALKIEADPTILKRRVWLETEWNEYKGGIDDVEETVGGLWAWQISPRQDWGFRFKLPYDWHITDNQSDAGLDDIKLATGTAYRLSPTWRTGGRLELRMPTSTTAAGDNDWRLQEMAAVAWDVTRWLTLSPWAEYNHSIAEEHFTERVQYLELFFPATFILPNRWAVSARYETRLDFEPSERATQSARVQVIKVVDKPPISFMLSLKRPFDGGQKEFQLNASITYFFR